MSADASDGSRELGPYRLARWRNSEFDDFEEWMAVRRAGRARTALARAPDITPLDRERIVAEIAAKETTLLDIHAAIRSGTGCRFALRLALRRHQPEITEADLEALEVEQGGMNAMFMWMLGLGALPDKSDSSDQPDEADQESPGPPVGSPASEPQSDAGSG